MSQRDPYLLAKDLRTLANLVEIAGEHRHAPYALRAAADALFAGLVTASDIQMGSRKISGVGPETRKTIATLADRGLLAALQDLNVDLPATVSELVSVPGVGPATAHTLYATYGIDSLAALVAALNEHRLAGMRGFGVERIHRMERDTKVLLERQHTVPIAIAWPCAVWFREALAQVGCVHRAEVTGPLRRLSVLTPRIELLAATDDPTQLRAAYTPYLTEAEPDTKTVTPADPNHPDLGTVIDLRFPWFGERIPIRIFTCRPSDFGREWLRTTGDAIHWQLVQTLLKQNGVAKLAVGTSEEAVYAAAGLPWLPPELREGRGVLQAPEALVSAAEIQGDLHVHTTWSDGSLTIAQVVECAEQLGYRYIAITDHSQSLTVAHGLTPDDLSRQHAEIQAVQKSTEVRILHGVECDIHADGTMDLPDETLAGLDIVIASVHGAMHQSRAAMTKRVLRAIEHPAVDILGHPTGRIIGRRAGLELDMDALLRAAAQHGTSLELNANPNRLDLPDNFLRQAAAMGIPISIDTDAHSRNELSYMDYGIRMARRGWLQPGHVLNAQPYAQLRRHLHKEP